MKYTFLLSFVLLLQACGGSKKTAGATNDAKDTIVTETPKADSVVTQSFKISIDRSLLEGIDKNKRKLLTWFFGKENAIRLLSCTKAIELVKTDADLYACYHFLDSVCNITTNDYMNSEDDPLQFTAHIDSISNLYHTGLEAMFPYLQFTCEAECTMPRIMLNYLVFDELAEKTEGERDNEYFALYKMIYVDCNCDGAMQPVWFDQNWDYGGNSLLGAGHHYKVFQKAQEIKKNNVFEKEIGSFEQQCLDDALNWETLFYTAEKAIDELKKIMKLDIGIKNKKKFEERIKKLQSPDKDLQLDCEHNDCQYG